MEEPRPQSYESMLREVLEALGRSTGPDFLNRLIRSLARVLHADIAFVGRLDDAKTAVETLALWSADGEAGPVRCDLAGTACALVAGGTPTVLPSGAAAAYPADALLSCRAIEGYAGAPLLSRGGDVFAMLVVLSRRPLERPDLAGALLEVFAARAAAELEALDTEQRLTRANLALRHALAARAASEVRLQDYVRASSDWFWEQDAALRFIYVSDGLRHVTGIDPLLIVGHTRDELRAGGTVVEANSDWEGLTSRIAARMAFRDIEYALRGPDGRLRCMRISGMPVFDENGRFAGYRGTGRDVTALTEARERQERAEQTLRDGIEAMPAGFAIFDADDRLTLWNSQYRDQILCAGGDEPAAGTTFEAWLRRSVERGVFGRFESEAASERFIAERMAYHRDPCGPPRELSLPGPIWVEVRARRTAEGGTVLVRTDITGRKLSEERLRSAIESLPAGFVMLDPAGRLVQSNRRYRDMFPDAVPLIAQGRPYAEILEAALAGSEGHRLALDTGLARLREANGTPHHHTTAAGRHVMVSYTRMADGGTVGVHVDITPMVDLQRQLAEATREAEEALAVRTRFLANVSHELRTPLNAVIGFSELMLMETQGPLDAKYREFAGIIKQSGEFLLSLILDILDMARIEAGKMTVAREPVDLGDVVGEALSMLSLQAQAKGLSLDVAIPPHAPSVRGDRRRLVQIVQNLLTNAVKFTERGGVTVSIACDGPDLVLSVADTGRGMSTEDIAFAMEPFQQRRGMDGHEVMEGTGLGLPLVKALVELHGGRFEMESAPGVGTTARVVLPAVAAGAAAV